MVILFITGFTLCLYFTRFSALSKIITRAPFYYTPRKKFGGAYSRHAVRPKPFLHNPWTKFNETSDLNSLEQYANTSFPVFQFEAASPIKGGFMQKIRPKPFLHNRCTKFYETSHLNSLEKYASTSFPVSQFQAASGKKKGGGASCKKFFFCCISNITAQKFVKFQI